jgi:hypothetical protein
MNKQHKVLFHEDRVMSLQYIHEAAALITLGASNVTQNVHALTFQGDWQS